MNLSKCVKTHCTVEYEEKIGDNQIPQGSPISFSSITNHLYIQKSKRIVVFDPLCKKIVAELQFENVNNIVLFPNSTLLLMHNGNPQLLDLDSDKILFNFPGFIKKYTDFSLNFNKTLIAWQNPKKDLEIRLILSGKRILCDFNSVSLEFFRFLSNHLVVKGNLEGPTELLEIFDLSENKTIGSLSKKFGLNYRTIESDNKNSIGLFSSDEIILIKLDTPNKITQSIIFESIIEVFEYPYYPNSILIINRFGLITVFYIPTEKTIRTYKYGFGILEKAFYNKKENSVLLIDKQNVLIRIHLESILELNAKYYDFLSSDPIVPRNTQNIILDISEQESSSDFFEELECLEEMHEYYETQNESHEYGGLEYDDLQNFEGDINNDYMNRDFLRRYFKLNNFIQIHPSEHLFLRNAIKNVSSNWNFADFIFAVLILRKLAYFQKLFQKE